MVPCAAVVLIDLDLNISSINPAAEQLFGQSLASVVGHKIPALLGEYDLAAKREQALAAGASSFDFVLPGASLSKSIEATLSPVYGSTTKQATGWMLVAFESSSCTVKEEQLSKTVCELQAIFDNTLLGLILTRDGRIARSNNPFEKLFGYTAKQLYGLEWTEFQTEIYTSEDAACMTGNNRVVRLKNSSGQKFWALVREMPLNDAGDNVLLYLFEDVTRRREMFTTIRQLSQAVEQSSNSIVITDTGGKIEYVNRAFVRITGYSAKEAIGLTPAVLKSGKTPQSVYKEMWETITGGKEWSGDFVNKKKNGDLYEEHVIVSPLRDENDVITHFVATKENIGDLKKARLRAESANQAKSTFLANMSHEIRTPMNAILGMSELLLTTELAAEQRKYLNTVNSSATHLLSIINDVLDYSKIEVDQLVLEESAFYPCAIVEEVVSTLGLQAEQKGLLLKQRVENGTDLPCLYIGDGLRLKQVLLNLVGNAIKFTDRGVVDIELSIEQSARENRHSLHFSVRDTGIGLSLAQQKDIFKRFSQTDSSATRKFGGTGLGLAISSRLVQMMGDSLQVSSAPAKGSEFSFTLVLPCGVAQRVEPEVGQEAVPETVANLSVLLVEDNLANQQLAIILLENQGHNVEVAKDGLAALRCLSRHRYDLLLMDIQMPVMDGLTATRYIREFEEKGRMELDEDPAIAGELALRLAGGHNHIIAMTATVLSEEQQSGIDGGLDGYLSKPYSRESLQDILQLVPGNVLSEQKQEALSSSSPEQVSIAGLQDHVVSSYGLDRLEAEKIVATYCLSLQENLQKLKQAVADHNLEEGTSNAHSLKGACLNLGLQDLAQRASVLEKELRKDILEHHGQEVLYFEDALRPLILQDDSVL